VGCWPLPGLDGQPPGHGLAGHGLGWLAAAWAWLAVA